MAMAIMIEKQSTKLIKPFVQTPPTPSQYKLGFIDEFAPAAYVGVVLFFSTNRDSNDNPTNFFAQLEKSLAKTLTRFYPLAGRHDDKTPIVDCNDQGAEFTHAKVNIKLQDFLVSQESENLIDEFTPFKIGTVVQQSDSLLAIQVTTFECGGVAIGVSATHKIVDAPSLCTLINHWAVTNQSENEIEFKGPGFISSLLFPARGLGSIPVVQPMNDEMLNKHTRKKLSFNESLISKLKAKGKKRWSKVQLVSSIIWKTFMDVDMEINNYQRDSILFQGINFREKMASLIPKDSCGNLWGFFDTECKDLKTVEELTDRLTDSVKKVVTNFSKVHHNSEEGQEMVLNSLLSVGNILESTNVVAITSWCKFPFTAVDFGFGKPVWVAPGTTTVKNTAYLMDDVEGNGVEAFVFLEVKEVPYFEEAFGKIVNAFAP